MGTLNQRKFVAGGLAATVLGVGLALAINSGGGSDPVTECSRAAEQLWTRALDAGTVAEIEALPPLNSLDECRGLTAEEKEEFHRRNAQKEDRVAGHVIRLALEEEVN